MEENRLENQTIQAEKFTRRRVVGVEPSNHKDRHLEKCEATVSGGHFGIYQK